MSSFADRVDTLDAQTPATILRRAERYEQVPVPDGMVVCQQCAGKGSRSRYDEGWRSLTHDPELAAQHTCMTCHGAGYVPAAWDPNPAAGS